MRPPGETVSSPAAGNVKLDTGSHPHPTTGRPAADNRTNPEKPIGKNPIGKPVPPARSPMKARPELERPRDNSEHGHVVCCRTDPRRPRLLPGGHATGLPSRARASIRSKTVGSAALTACSTRAAISGRSWMTRAWSRPAKCAAKSRIRRRHSSLSRSSSASLRTPAALAPPVPKPLVRGAARADPL